MAPWVLGLGGSDHDFSAALMCVSDIRVAIEEERVSRRKHSRAHWYENPLEHSIEYCLKAEKIRLDEISTIVGSETLPSRVRHEFQARSLQLFPHHLCHAASAYMMLPSGTRAGIIVYDGYGSIWQSNETDPLRNHRETFSFYRFTQDGYERLGGTSGLSFVECDDFPIGVTNSAGMLYELITSLLGYDEMDSGKTMGLSSHGRPKYVDDLEKFIIYGEDASDCFRCETDNPKLAYEIKKILQTGGNTFSVRADLAASVQVIVNKALLNCGRFFEDMEMDYLCISGGCGLNSVANSFFVENSQNSIPVFIPPHCGDAGLAFGALWLHEFERYGRSPNITVRGEASSVRISRPGKLYTENERHAAVQQAYPELVFDQSVRSASDLAGELAAGAVIGLFNGSSEFGPRALGGRSILADPRFVRTKERINRQIKHREPFRPLAPIVLQDDFSHYFIDIRCKDFFMQKIAKAREVCKKVAPAIVHVDGSARVQVVCEATDPFLAEVLGSFRDQTGVGLLINTSFNRRGEPIVESPLDAVQAFLDMRLDGLFMDGEFYRPVRPSVLHDWGTCSNTTN